MDENNFIIRVEGIPFYIKDLRRYSQFFRDLDLTNLNSDEINGGIISNNSIHYTESNSDMTKRMVEYAMKYGHRPCGLDTLPRYVALQRLFETMSTPDDICIDFGFYDYEIMDEMYNLLTEFKIDKVISERYHSTFPYYRSLSHERSPYGNANRPFYTIGCLKDRKTLTGWDLYKRALHKEGTKCLECYKFNTWRAPLNLTNICKCNYDRDDEYNRSNTNTNPYFHEDNKWQREQDEDDYNRRQD